MNTPYFGRPAAAARIEGVGNTSGISGTVLFYNIYNGVLVVAEMNGLPSGERTTNSRVFGFHIHEGASCTGPDLTDTGGHFNPTRRPRPYHAGDLPPLFEVDGRAYMAVLTGRFQTDDIIGRTVVIHSDPDDFHSQPARDLQTMPSSQILICLSYIVNFPLKTC